MANNTLGRLRAGLLVGLVTASLTAITVHAPARADPPLATLYSFAGGTDGANPTSSVIERDGALYGTTTAGGGAGLGTVFRLTPSGGRGRPWTETVLHSFAGGTDGATPYAGLVADHGGRLYGTTLYGGAYGKGTVFQLTPPTVPGRPWTEVVLYSFAGGADGANPYGGVILDGAGALYGTTAGSLYGLGPDTGTLFKLTPPVRPDGRWTETVLHRFVFSLADQDGVFPTGDLVADGAGAIYGTTLNGGAAGGGGTVFRLAPPALPGGGWTETILASFVFGLDMNPVGLLLHDGAAYVTLNTGRHFNKGSIIRLTPSTPPTQTWTQTILHSFLAVFDNGPLPSPGGFFPIGSLIADRAGALYGVTTSGGIGTCTVSNGLAPGCGVLYKLAPPIAPGGTWTETVLHSFTGADGAQPSAALIFGCRGEFFGTTAFGGRGYDGSASSGHGTVFTLMGPHGRSAPVPSPGTCAKSANSAEE